MTSWLILFAIITAGLLTGGLIALRFLPVPIKPRLTYLFAAGAIGIGVIGWLALLLAEFGIFSLVGLAALWLAVVLILIMFLWLYYKKQITQYQIESIGKAFDFSKPGWKDWIEIFILGGWLVLAGWLFFRPHEYIMGGADAGVYISLGAEIAQHGGFAIQDPLLADLDQTFVLAVLRPLPGNPIASSYLFPGFYITDISKGTITPQFYPLHPVWLAAVYAFSGSPAQGIYAELVMTGLWMTLASLAIYFTVRELAGRMAAYLLLAALSVNALQVWFARYPSTEALTQFLLWAGLWGTLMWLGGRRPNELWAFLSGIMLGSVFLVRIDVLILLPIFALFIIALLARKWKASNWWFLIPFILLVIQSILHGLLLSAPYFYETIGFGLRIFWRSWLVSLLVILTGILVIAIIYRFRGRFGALARLQQPLKITLIVLVLIGACYGWFVRPLVGEARLIPDTFSQSTLLLTNHENWLRLGWYLFPSGIWLGVIGCCLLIWQAKWRTSLILAVGLVFSALYLWDVRANPHQIYVMRRFVPAVLPFFLLSAAYLLGWLIKRPDSGHASSGALLYVRPITGLLLAVIWLAGLAWSARGFISQVDHEGIVDQLLAFERNLQPNSVVIFNDQSPVGLGDFWGTPLKFIFGYDVFTLRDPDILTNPQLVKMVKIWQNNGRSVVWIGEPAWLDENKFAHQDQSFEFHSLRLESSYEHKPQVVEPVRWILPMAQLEMR